MPPEPDFDGMWRRSPRRPLVSVRDGTSWPRRAPAKSARDVLRSSRIADRRDIVVGVGSDALRCCRPPRRVAPRRRLLPSPATRHTDASLERPYEVETSKYLGQTAALLVALPSEVKAGRADAAIHDARRDLFDAHSSAHGFTRRRTIRRCAACSTISSWCSRRWSVCRTMAIESRWISLTARWNSATSFHGCALPQPTFLRIEEKRDESHHASHDLVCRGHRARGSGAAHPSSSAARGPRPGGTSCADAPSCRRCARCAPRPNLANGRDRHGSHARAGPRGRSCRSRNVAYRHGSDARSGDGSRPEREPHQHRAGARTGPHRHE